MPRLSRILLALFVFLLHGLAREVDCALGLVLRAEVEPAGLLAEVGRAMAAEGAAGVGRVLAWVLGGTAVAVALAWWRARQEDRPLAEALPREVPTLTPLLLRPVLTLVALVSVGLQPSYPWAFTLPVALTQDLGVAQDVGALAALLAIRLPHVRIPPPSPRAVFLLSFLFYALLTPEWARHWDGHPGNEPKYLRMAVALGHELTLDAEGVTAAMEDLPTTPMGEALRAAARSLARESWRMTVAVFRGGAGRDGIRATRITRQTVRGKDGGVYYVLAPGPSVLLAPTLRIDRALNRSRGTSGRLAVSVVAWNALAALLVAAVFRLVRDATDRPGVAATLTFFFAFLPPLLFYFFQFYPEMPGALVLAAAFHALALKPERLGRHPWLLGILLATLPWLHQKFLPVWLVLVPTAVWVVWRSQRVIPSWSPAATGGRNNEQSFRGPPLTTGPEESAGNGNSESLVARPSRASRDDRLTGRASSDQPPPSAASDAPVTVGTPVSARNRRWLVALLFPQAVSLYLTALYNFAITGSVRPDALFLAWGPGGVTTARMGQGLLGILLDARYGILPYVPLLVVAGAGLVVGGARRFAIVLPAAGVYYLTVASADNWAGAVCNLGRYVMPLAPLAVALVGVALTRVSGRRGALAVGLILAGWSALFALALWYDPIAANDSALLLAKSAWADGNQYIPNLFLRRWSDGAPGLWARIILWVGGIVVTAFWWYRVARVPSATGGDRRAKAGASPVAALAGTLAVLLIFALGLEQWPSGRDSPSFGGALATGPGVLAFAAGEVEVRGDELIVGPGSATLLVRSADPAPALPLTVGGHGVLRTGGLSPLVLRPTGVRVDLPLRPYHVVTGKADRRAVFARASLDVDGQAVLRPAAAGSPSEREGQ